MGDGGFWAPLQGMEVSHASRLAAGVALRQVDLTILSLPSVHMPGWTKSVQTPADAEGGRDRVAVRPSQIVPMTDTQRRLAIQRLAVLLDSWVNRRVASPDRREDLGQAALLSVAPLRGRTRPSSLT